jgi:hypothetical protein
MRATMARILPRRGRPSASGGDWSAPDAARAAEHRVKGGRRAADANDVAHVSGVRAATPPDDDVVWQGDWFAVSTRADVWAQAAVNRTVRALVELHPFRLGDAKAAPRLVQWVAAQPRTVADPGDDLGQQALAVLTVTAREPDLDRSGPHPPGTSADALGLALGSLVGAVAGSWRGVADTVVRRPRWGGALVRLPDVWLPPMAFLPRAARGIDDPATAWRTESVDFDERFAVYTSTERTTAALLTPAVMALLLDAVPQDCAVTVSGDALHTWWPYPPAAPSPGHAADVVMASVRLARALPSFVLRDHPDRSGEVQAELDDRAEQAREYRAGRRPGHSPDPVLQRIYDEARARAGIPPAP